MITINKDKFSIATRYDLLNENGNIEFWCQPDFAYKMRLHVYDKNNDEIGYVQYKILSTQDGVEYYDNKDNKLDLNSYIVKGKDYNYEITHNDVVVLKSILKENKIEVDVKDNLSLLILFGLIN